MEPDSRTPNLTPDRLVRRGEFWWVELPAPSGSEPGYRRPALIVQSDAFTASRIKTVTVAAVTSNLKLAAMPGNVLVSAAQSGLDRDSVVNVSQLTTIDKSDLVELAGYADKAVMRRCDEGLRLLLSL